MRIRILTITHKVPSWVLAGSHEYLQRLQRHCSIEIMEIAAEKRTANSHIPTIVARESNKIISSLKPRHFTIALHVTGQQCSTEDLAQHLVSWQNESVNIDFIIGGADGLSQACLHKANQLWSLSKLTFPHTLVRIILLEQLYRAFCIIKKHPYHRG